MDFRRSAGRVRWTCLGGVGRRDAGLGRVVSLFERNLRSAKIGARRFIPLHLATFIQRSAVDCVGSGGALAIRRFLLARTGAGLGHTHAGGASSATRPTASDLGSNARDSARNRSLRFRGVSALPAHHRDFKVFAATLAWRDGDDRLDHRDRPPAFQRAAGLRFSSGRVLVFTKLLSRSGRGDADLRL